MSVPFGTKKPACGGLVVRGGLRLYKPDVAEHGQLPDRAALYVLFHALPLGEREHGLIPMLLEGAHKGCPYGDP